MFPGMSTNPPSEPSTAMVRCTRCLLPSSYPGAVFDGDGVCNHCRAFAQTNLPGEEVFLEKIRSKRGARYDCVLGISGGKDSCYVAYLAKKKFGLRALAVSYDFPFMVDLARENIKTVCRNLDLELKVVKSRDNLEYDLLRNHLMSLAPTGTTWGQCIFCHYGIEAVLYQAAQTHGIPFILSGTTKNELWWDPGNRTSILAKRLKALSVPDKMRFAWYQGKACLRLVEQRQFPIPGNSPCRVYRRAHTPANGPETIPVFDYIYWDQRLIENTLRQEIGWQKPPKTLTWRYDCILEPLLDFTYKKEFGISSAGLYLCGLIRSGLESRDAALRMLQENEDQKRLDGSLKTVLDFLKIPLPVQQKFFNGARQ
jgi:glucosamine--fructose-6-phosphate aminotransferase (isomerizing)